VLEDLRNKIISLWDETRQQIIYQPLDVNNVDKNGDYVALEYGRHYVRLWLAHAYLAKKVQYLQTWFPAVHSLVQFDFQGEAVEFPLVADSTKSKMTKDNMTGDVISQNFVLTPLIPFNNGTVSLDAGLTAVQGANFLQNFIGTLSDFSSLLAVPQFSSALQVAAPLAKALQSLLNAGGVHLALHDAFAAGKMGGYWMAVRATSSNLDPTTITVENDQLRVPDPARPGQTRALQGYDYLLFRLEVTETGPDYRSLTTIQEPMRQAHAGLRNVETEKADGFYRAAIIAAHEARELSNADRTRVKTQLKTDYEELKRNLGFSPLVGADYDLSESMKRAMTVDMAIKEGEPAWDWLFSATGTPV
jgi:hypothetical protein